MKGKNVRKKRSPTIRQSFRALTPYMARIAKGSLKRNTWYSLCVKASLAKCYEFNVAIPRLSAAEGAFFAMSALRGICEDLIVLRFIGRLPSADREELLRALQGLEMGKRIKQQDAFFRSFRPQQPVIRLKDPDSPIASCTAAAQAVWRQHGWPNFKGKDMPPVREIAERQGSHHLAILYDYLYRLTSGGVHFSVQSLLRSGWGEIPNIVFSTKHFRGYFEAYCSVYGSFLFCIYFEFFGRLLRPGKHQREIVQAIREGIFMAERWPEMLTFEEMNQKPPEGGHVFRKVVSAAQSTMQRQLIPRGRGFGDKRSAGHQFARQALRIVAAGAAVDRKEKAPTGA
jgi:hypothetical protein